MLSGEEIETLRGMEDDLWREETRFEIPYMERLLAEDFIEIGRSGRIYDRATILAAPRQAIDVVLPLPNFRVRVLSDAVVQITYDSCVTSDNGPLYAHRSSIWTREAGGWKLRFHQGTPYEP